MHSLLCRLPMLFCRCGSLTALVAAVASASEGSWIPTASMQSIQGDVLAAPLEDGRLLVIGFTLGSSRSVTEIYDPSSATWTRQADPIVSRNPTSAITRLLDGRVLVAGCETMSRISEIFDPSDGRWTQTGDMNFPRRYAKPVALFDGRVLISGGSSDDLGGAELFDPRTNQWTITGSMSVGRFGHAMVLLQDGTVLVAGGVGPIASSELYDPSTETWTRVGDMSRGRSYFPLTLLADGRVLAQPHHQCRSV